MKKLLILITLEFLTFSSSPAANEIIGWGVNIAGQATGIPVSSSVLCSTGVITIAGQTLTNGVAISCGGNHSLALKGDGTVVGWGWNDAGQATGIISTNSSAITNGVVTIKGQVLSNVIAIVAGMSSSLALKSDGSIVEWGSVSAPNGLNKVTAIALGFSDQGFAVEQDGTVVSWNIQNSGKSAIPPDLSNVVTIATASKDWGGKNLALKRDGTVFEWDNRGNYGSIVAGLSNVVSVAGGTRDFGGSHYLALKKDGTVFGWGINDDGQATGVRNGIDGLVRINGQVVSNIVAIAAGNGYSLGLAKNGTITEWGRSFRHLVDVPVGLSNVIAISAGGNFCLAITTNSAVAEKFQQRQ